MKKVLNIVISLVAALILIFQLSCGGGGGSSSLVDPSSITWTKDVFQDESGFKNACENPRSGVDLNGRAFSDVAGSILQENNWLRSWSNNTYLWYNEIADQNPANFTNTADYFDVLVTNELTNSGNPKDRFHFTYDSAEWLQLNQSGQSGGYGAKFRLIASSPPRQIVVAYTIPNTPATQQTANLMRGAEILSIDGVDAINASDQTSVNTLNAGLFPSTEGESHTFEVMDLGATESRTITMVSEIITSPPVLNTSTIQTSSGNVGYLLFNSHNAVAEEQLVDAVNQLSADNINELVLDLRYNGGGLLDVASELAYMIAGPTVTAGKVFDKTIFNDKHPNVNPVTGSNLEPTPFHDKAQGFSLDAGTALPSLNLNRVFILSTAGTCSASEAIINGLRGVDVEVVLIGSTTCGKPYGFYPTDNCGTTYFTIQFKGENDKLFGDYSDGFSPENTAGTVGTLVPGCSVADDFTHQLGDQQEDLLATALSYRDTGVCPTPTGKAVSQKSFVQNKNEQNAALKDPRILQEMILSLPQN